VSGTRSVGWLLGAAIHFPFLPFCTVATCLLACLPAYLPACLLACLLAATDPVLF